MTGERSPVAVGPGNARTRHPEDAMPNTPTPPPPATAAELAAAIVAGLCIGAAIVAYIVKAHP